MNQNTTHRYYYQDIERLLTFLVPPHRSLLKIVYGKNEFSNRFNATNVKTVDLTKKTMTDALSGDSPYDYILLINTIEFLPDIQNLFEEIHRLTKPQSRVIITFHNPLWQPLGKLAEFLRLKTSSPWENWVSMFDMENFLRLAGFEVIKKGHRVLLPLGPFGDAPAQAERVVARNYYAICVDAVGRASAPECP